MPKIKDKKVGLPNRWYTQQKRSKVFKKTLDGKAARQLYLTDLLSLSYWILAFYKNSKVTRYFDILETPCILENILWFYASLIPAFEKRFDAIFRGHTIDV